MNPLFPFAVLGVAAIALFSPSANAPSSSVDDGTPLDYSGGDESPVAGLYTDESMTANSQISAFLHVILQGESSNNYGAYVGGGSFTDFSHHPALPPTNWPGRVIGGATTHACGGYQFEPGTWSECAKALNLTDFSPASQDAAATFLLKRRGAYDAIVAGEIAIACDLLRNEWQMFTQSKWNPTMVGAMFETYGGVQA